MSETFKVEFPQGKIYVKRYKGKDVFGSAYIEYNPRFVNDFNRNGNKVQMFLDKITSEALMPYVSFRSGTQQRSIKLATVLGSGRVVIGVPYAELQAYSKRIKKRVGKRGTKPFERMKSDKKDSILRQIATYSRRLNNG